MTDKLSEILARLEKAEAERWELETLGADVKKYGHYVFMPSWGAVAVCPKESPQHSAHPSRMKFIAEAGRDIAWLAENYKKSRYLISDLGVTIRELQDENKRLRDEADND